MSRGSQARIIAIMFAVGALALLAVICEDWWSDRAVQVGGAPPMTDADGRQTPMRGPGEPAR